MKRPLLITLWFVGCVTIGLLLAWHDGISLHSIRQVAFLAAGIGVSVALASWWLARRR